MFYIYVQEFLFQDGFQFRYHLKKQTNLSLFMVTNNAEDLKNYVTDAMMFIMDNQHMFPIDFMVKFRGYCFHVLTKGKFSSSQGSSYSCSMCCSNFAPGNFVSTIGTRIDTTLKKFEKILNKIGVEGDPEKMMNFTR